MDSSRRISSAPRLMFTLEHFLRVVREECIVHPCKKIDIASFRIGSSPHLIEILKEVGKTVPIRLLIGVSSAQEGAEAQMGVDPCESIAEEVISDSPNIQARIITGSHMKCWIFHRRKQKSSYIAGGRNLNFSQWEDIMVSIVDQPSYEQLRAHFDYCWQRARPVEVTDFTKAWMENEKTKEF